jgi:hypothetical protein
MNIGRTLDDYIDALANARHALRSPSILIPFLAFGLLQVVIVVLLAFFAVPPFSTLMFPVVRALGGDAALHYPTHFVLLPSLYQRIYLPLAATLGFLLWSYGAWLMVGHHEAAERIPGRSFRAAWPGIILIGMVFVVVTVVLGRGFGWLTSHAPRAVPGRVFTLAGIALIASVQALMLYAPIVLRIRGGGAVSALRASARYARHNFAATAMLVTTVLVVHTPLDALIANADSIATQFRPEAVFQLMIGSIVLEVMTAFLLFAGAVGLALPEEGGMR